MFIEGGATIATTTISDTNVYDNQANESVLS
jgi:hypothetical protein